jgi:hypothetical protein
MSAIAELKECLKRYQKVDNQLHEINQRIYQLRETRRCVEDEMAQIVKLDEFSAINKLKLEDDGSTIQIIPPGSNKPWGLSKKDLQSHLQSYFETVKNPSYQTCLEHIITEQTKKLVTNEYSFNRIVKQQ